MVSMIFIIYKHAVLLTDSYSNSTSVTIHHTLDSPWVLLVLNTSNTSDDPDY